MNEAERWNMKCLAVAIVMLGGAFFLSTCVFAGDLPDPMKTPGEANPVLTQAVLCAPGFTTRDYRRVSKTLKAQVYKSYGAVNHRGVCAGREGCEVDHLISLEIGGANTVKNLWPQSFSGTWNAHVKDALENKLRQEVCRGGLALEEAQREISTDWVASWKKWFERDAP